MLGYIISDKEEINFKENEIQSFKVLCKTNLNIFVIEYNKFYSKILYKNDIINLACGYGHVQVLEWFKNSGYEFKYNRNAINYACCYGHVQVLRWFKNYGYEFKYNVDTIYWASFYKKIKVLEFFNNRNVKKVIKWSKHLNFNKTIKYKTKNNYIKGYNKN